MSKSAHGTPRNYTIFAIIVTDDSGNLVAYIGKTVSQNLLRVLRRHTAGENKLTAEDFLRGTYEQPPTIHELQTIYGDAAYAYRYVISWLRRFDDAGFVTLTYPGIEYAAYHMLPETEAIYQRVLDIPLEPLLSTPYSPPPKITVEPPAVHNAPTQLLQLNIRVDHSEFDAFCALCEENNLTRREGIVMLLSEHKPAVSDPLILEQKATIIEQLEAIKALNERATRLSRGANADINLKNTLEFCRIGIARYIELSLGEDNTNEKAIKCLSWNQFDASDFDRRQYDYPEADGYTVLQMEAMCYGHGRRPAIFLWGIDTERKQRFIKLRYYPKTNYMGLSIPHSPYLQKGNLILIGHKTASDGASDVYMALPLSKGTALWHEAFATEGNRPSLDDLIRNANRTTA